MFGAIAIYEAYVSWEEQQIANPLEPYRIPKEVLPE